MIAFRCAGRIVVVAILFSCSVGATLAVASAAGKPTTSPIKLLPSSAQGSPLSGPSYFHEGGRPGSTLYLHALVGNGGTSTATVVLQPVDAQSGLFGGVSYDLPNQNLQHLGAWVRLNRDRVRLRPHENTVVNFQVHIPRGLRSGQYVGGLTAYVPVRHPRETKFGALLVQLRSVAAVVVTAPGPTYGQFQIGGVRAVYEPSGLFASILMSNTGNLLIKGRGYITVTKAGSSKPAISRGFSVGTTVPHTSLRYPIPWVPKPAYGSYNANVTLTWWDGKTAWKSSFRLGPPPPKPRRPGGAKIPTVRVGATSNGLMILALVLGCGVVIGLGSSAWWIRNRRKRVRGAAMDSRADKTPLESLR